MYEQSARLSGLNAKALAWLEDEGGFDLFSIAKRIVEAIAGEGDVMLVGHSLGTPLAVLAALTGAQRKDVLVRGLVLSNSGANTRGHGDAGAIVRRIKAEWAEPMWDAFVGRCFYTTPAEPLLNEIRRYPARLQSLAVADAIQSQIEIDLLPLLGGLPDLPVAVVHGQYDVARTLAHAEELAGAIKGASLHVLPTGHTSCAEEAREFAEIMRRVAESVIRRSGGD
ncbi:alpha/beta fold hydrolase [Paraburkholderia tropica]|uniref:alpha/beta fold hydrolase n=1 Tax=Paraburkholderia tropica TaxID=92647 RepID=UPI002ABDEF15|nr:alpha/beta hydrolase [Paraburkholderia tropica]